MLQPKKLIGCGESGSHHGFHRFHGVMELLKIPWTEKIYGICEVISRSPWNLWNPWCLPDAPKAATV